MTFSAALRRAKDDGARITRGSRESWLEYDHGVEGLTLHNGQAHRVRWVGTSEDGFALDWVVLREKDSFAVDEESAQDEARLDIVRRMEEPLRDRFAMAALTGLIAHTGTENSIGADVRLAYAYADAALRERKGSGNGSG